jgi:EmrB/QacA subfamily drug resistance transporter
VNDPVPSAHPRRWQALAVLGLVQFMLVLDMTVVNVALPRIQRDLSLTVSGLAWVVNAYVLMAGGFMLLGGRTADIHGRRRCFLLGVGLFAAASVACGAAQTAAVLVAARFCQGAGEALAGPASLGLVVLLFDDPQERAKALGLWGGLAGLGGTVGTVIGGALTDLASWRLIFFVNVPVAVAALIVVPMIVGESRAPRPVGRPDYAGALASAAGLVSLVYGILQGATHPWTSTRVAAPMFASLVLLAAAAGLERRATQPLIPTGFFRNRTRVLSNAIAAAFTAAFFAYVYLTTLYEQQVLTFSPLRTGLSYLPLGLGIGAGIGIGTALIGRIGVRPVLAISCVGSAVGLLLSSMIGPHGRYASEVLPGMIVLAVFNGVGFPALSNGAMDAVTDSDSSLAAAIQTTMQQIGGALGLAVFVTVAVRHGRSTAAHGPLDATAAAHGYGLALQLAAALLLAAAAVTAASGRRRQRLPVTTPEQPNLATRPT